MDFSRRRETVDCFNCTTSRRLCDRTRHRCTTCTHTAELCQGYPRELQFITGVTSRGKQKGQTLGVSQVWESTTPTNHAFVFKPERPQRRKRVAHKTAVRQARVSQQPSPVESVASLVPVGSPANICGSDSFEAIFDDLDSSFIQGLNNEDAIFSLPLSPQSFWQNEVNDLLLKETAPSPSITSFPDLAPSQLLTFYDTELCALPLTFDFSANPFRCETERSPHLVHAVFAISIQHISRMNDSPEEDVLARQVTTYKNSATELCTAALRVTQKQSNKSVLDSILVLFALDTLISSLGPWTSRLMDGYQKIESIGGIDAVASSPHAQAQLSMFVWWDCIIALLSRSEPVFPASYFEVALSYNADPSWDIHVLTGVPKELFQYFRELVQLASEREQISKMKYARFDTRRVYELEQAIQKYTVAEFVSRDDETDSEEAIHNWHDYRNASNAWKYALLLYLARVLRWDRASGARLPEATSLSRLLLDSVRSCRPVSSLRKQLLFPLFLAGSEAMDSYSRTFIEDYCESWYRNCRYTMFIEALGLLKEIWAQRDLDRGNFGVWWGGVMGNKQPCSSGFLFG